MPRRVLGKTLCICGSAQLLPSGSTASLLVPPGCRAAKPLCFRARRSQTVAFVRYVRVSIIHVNTEFSPPNVRPLIRPKPRLYVHQNAELNSSKRAYRHSLSVTIAPKTVPGNHNATKGGIIIIIIYNYHRYNSNDDNGYRIYKTVLLRKTTSHALKTLEIQADSYSKQTLFTQTHTHTRLCLHNKFKRAK